MKRFKCLIIVVATALLLCACTPQTNYGFTASKPWSDSEKEYTKYQITKYKFSGNEKTPVATGFLEYILIYDATTVDKIGYSSLQMDFVLTYNNNADDEDKGKTDRITSFTLFQRDSLATHYSVKTVALADRADRDNLSYTLSANYFGQASYNGAVLPANQASIKFNEGDTQTMSLRKGTYYDNELLYYLVRCKPLESAAQFAFMMTNIFDSFLYDKVTTYTMGLNVGKDYEDIEIHSALSSKFNFDPDAEEPGDNSVISCFNVKLGINTEKSGPSTTLYYAVNPFQDSKEKRHDFMLVKFITSEYAEYALYTQTEYMLVDAEF